MKRVVVLRTYSASCFPIFDPLRKLGWEVIEFDYTNGGSNNYPFHQLSEQIDVQKPDWILMLGVSDNDAGNVPPLSILRTIAERYPMVHVCCDGSERIWWPQIESYIRNVPFALHVNIDGVRAGAFAEMGMTTLCPVDHEQFTQVQFDDRSVTIGFCGGWGEGHPRGQFIPQLIAADIVHAVNRPFGDYASYCHFLSDCKCVWNHALTGTADHMHVKARIVESAFAGAMVLEQKGSPLSNWFIAGSDYMAWDCIDDIRNVRDCVKSYSSEAKAMALRMQRKMIEKHSAKAFYDEVLARIGVQ